MRNQDYQNWGSRGVLATALFITIGMGGRAIADASACLNPYELTLGGQVKMKFCEIPSAQGVLIGSEYGFTDEMPVKPRNFKKFQIGQFEVTQLQYKTVTGNEPWKANGTLLERVQENDDHPASYVPYVDSQQFARVLNLIDKKATYRLPTEAEFEYATRAGTTTEYYWGDEFDSNYAYRSEPHARKVDSCPNPTLSAMYPGYCANDFGLYHMLGNVAELVLDAYVDNYTNVPIDGNLPIKIKASASPIYFVGRGGGFLDSTFYLRSAARFKNHYYSSPNFGFRIVRELK